MRIAPQHEADLHATGGPSHLAGTSTRPRGTAPELPQRANSAIRHVPIDEEQIPRSRQRHLRREGAPMRLGSSVSECTMPRPDCAAAPWSRATMVPCRHSAEKADEIVPTLPISSCSGRGVVDHRVGDSRAEQRLDFASRALVPAGQSVACVSQLSSVARSRQAAASRRARAYRPLHWCRAAPLRASPQHRRAWLGAADEPQAVAARRILIGAVRVAARPRSRLACGPRPAQQTGVSIAPAIARAAPTSRGMRSMPARAGLQLLGAITPRCRGERHDAPGIKRITSRCA